MFEWLDRKAEAERPVLDTGYLDRLRGHLGDGVVDELLADGLIEITDRLGRLRGMPAEDDFDGIAQIGHDLVGTAGHLGLAALSLAAMEMNRRARSAPDGDAKALAAPVLTRGAAAAEALRDHLAERRRET